MNDLGLRLLCIIGGGVKCWGDNVSGQLGDFSTTAKTTPAQVFGLTSGAVAIAAGGSTTCALMATGAIKCWGANTFGQIGNGDTVKKNVPTLGPVLPGVTAIAVGGNHACAIADGGKIYCWGAGGAYQMGNGTTTASNTEAKVLGIGGATAVAVGDTFSEVLSLGSVLHWGASLIKSTTCSLQNGTEASSYACWVPSNVSSLPATLVSGNLAIAAGAGFVCRLTSGGTVECAGDGVYGQLGLIIPWTSGATSYWGAPNGCYDGFLAKCVSPTKNFTTVSGLSGVTCVSAGAYHACAVTTGGAVYCWGHGAQGQLGNSSNMKTENTPGLISGSVYGVKSATAGGSHTCALLNGGAVKCWGYGKYGQLGVAGGGNSAGPIDVPDLPTGVAALTAGSDHTCALLSTGAVKCWGYNASGQLGDGTIADKSKPTDLPALATDVATIAAGSTANHTCAILKDGTLRCWGQNLYGQIGDGVPITSAPAYVVGFGP